MAFDVLLQYNASQPNVIDKSLTTLYTISGVMRDGSSVIDPVIVIDASYTNLGRCNYITVSSFGRSYFVHNMVVLSNRMVELHCHVDVLYTYRAGIRACKGILRRQENDWNLYLNDGSLRTYQNPMVMTRLFPSGFSTQDFVLAVAGS